MSYLVLARKWRPQTFEEIVGQESIVKTLTNSISRTRVPHALLFTGVRGVGKTTIARVFSKALNCDKGPTVTPCNNCPNCKEISGGTSMDVLEIDGASKTSVNDVRELRENVRYLPSKSKYKIYIIDEVHMLSESAFNALLKTLEEPPDNVVFMFATTEPESIPQTIISRCQRFDLKTIPEEKIFEKLRGICSEEKFKINEHSLRIIAREGKGSLRDALSIMDKMIAFGGDKIEEDEIVEILGLVKREFLHGTMRQVVDKDTKSLLQTVDDVYKQGYDPKIFLSELLEYARNLLILKIDETGKLAGILEDEFEEISALAKRTSVLELEFVFDILKDAIGEISRTDYPRFILELALIRASSVTPLLKMDEAIQNLKDMGQPGAGSPPGNANLHEEWKDIAREIKNKKPYLAIALESADIHFDNGKMTIIFRGDSFNADKVSEPESLSFIKGIISEKFGKNMNVEVLKNQDQKSPKKTAPQNVSSPGQEPANKENVKTGGGAVSKALNILGGRVEEDRFKT